MSVNARCLISAKYASNSDNTEYTAPGSTYTIIDKFTATNTDSSARTVSVNLIPSAGTVGASNLIISAFSIAAGATKDFSELQNQILNTGEAISVVASVASKVVIRASGRETT